MYTSSSSVVSWQGKPLTLERVVQIMQDMNILFTYTDYKKRLDAGFSEQRYQIQHARERNRRHYRSLHGYDEDSQDSDEEEDSDLEIKSADEIRLNFHYETQSMINS